MSYLTEVIADSPVHFWRMADGGGQLAHDVGSAAFHLTVGAFLAGYSGVNSDSGSSFCNGANGMFSQDVLVTVNSPWSTELWFWAHDFAQGANALLLAWDNVTNPTTNIVFNTTGTVQGSVSGTNALSAATTVQRWHYVVVTYDGANIRLYLDAVLAATVALGGPQNIARKISLGSNVGNTANFFRGFLAEVAVYAAALTPTRITAHFLAADTPNSTPVARGIGVVSSGGSGGVSPADALDDIRAAVLHVYQNAP